MPLMLVGNYGSPYSRKMRAVLRYRRIPFQWIRRGSKLDVGIPDVPVSLIPVLVFEDGEAMIDSTFQIRRLESMHAERAVIPPDPVLAAVDALIEDYGDEWLTKAMFHYRWWYPADIDKASRLLPLIRGTDVGGPGYEQFVRTIADRQIGRLGVVGSNETTKPVIEDSYRRLLGVLDELFVRQPFIAGERPGAGDFGVFGQLTQLVLFDPTPVALAEREAPRVIAWVLHTEDLASDPVDDDGWLARAAIADALRPLLCEIGRVYAPFLLANADALEAGADRVECEIDGRKWVQQPFPYQGKCLRELRATRERLGAADRTAFDTILDGTGCDALYRSR